MQELLLLTGDAEKPQDGNKVNYVTVQMLYATMDYDPVQFVTTQLLYAVQEENL